MMISAAELMADVERRAHAAVDDAIREGMRRVATPTPEAIARALIPDMGDLVQAVYRQRLADLTSRPYRVDGETT